MDVDRFLVHRDRFQADPVAFFREVLGVTGIWPGMVSMAESVRDNRETAVAGCHSSSKTFTAACLAWWWVICFQPAKVVTTAPGGRQVGDVLWAEIRERYRLARIPLGGEMMPRAPSWRLNDRTFMTGFSTTEDTGGGATKAQGYKSPNLLLIMDEAVVIARGLWESSTGILTFPHNHALAIANPTDPASEFARCWRRGSGWNTINLDALATPNLVAGKVVHPHLPTAEWVDGMRRKFGEDSPAFDARVRGRFPSSSIDTLITLADLANAYEREPALGVLSIGVDVARFGDDLTTIYGVSGGSIVFREAYQGQDTVFTAGRVIEVAGELGLDPSKAHLLAVDDTGLGGGVTDHLRACGWSVSAENFGSKARDETTHANRRTELWMTLRDWLRDSATLSELAPEARRDLEADLPGTKFKYRPDSRMILEPKADMKKRLGHSPDHGDALALALAWRTKPEPISIGVEGEVMGPSRGWGFGINPRGGER